MYSELREVGEEVKAINENLLTCECVRLFVNWGESWKSGEECERKWGRGEGKG